MLYHALIDPHLLYAISVWGAPFSSYTDRLRVLQNNAVRAINGVKQSQHISLYYLINSILKLDDLYKFEIAKLMFLFSKRLLTKPFQNFFVEFKIKHIYTRAVEQLNYCFPSYKTTRLQRTFKHLGVKVWNDLSLFIKQFKNF